MNEEIEKLVRPPMWSDLPDSPTAHLPGHITYVSLPAGHYYGFRPMFRLPAAYFWLGADAEVRVI